MNQRMPDDCQADAKVFMDEYIAHPSHFQPGQLGVFLLDTFGDTAGSFANHFQVAKDRVDRLVILSKCFQGHSTGITIDFLNCLQNILDAQLSVSSGFLSAHGQDQPGFGV